MNVPCTSTTGYGCAAVGVQLVGLTPGGSTPGDGLGCSAAAIGALTSSAARAATATTNERPPIRTEGVLVTLADNDDRNLDQCAFAGCFSPAGAGAGRSMLSRAP